MNLTTVINIQIFIQQRSNKLVNRDKLVRYIEQNDINAQAWYYSLLTLYEFQIATELKMLETQNIWEVVK